MKIYVASSWRNNYQPEIVRVLRELGHEVYDFKNPKPGDNGFHWSDIDPNWKSWTPDQYVKGLEHPLAESGFGSDMNALAAADATVLVLPCGRSAHLEMGYAIGAKQKCVILLDNPLSEPELMYKMCDVVTSVEELTEHFRRQSYGDLKCFSNDEEWVIARSQEDVFDVLRELGQTTWDPMIEWTECDPNVTWTMHEDNGTTTVRTYAQWALSYGRGYLGCVG